MHKVIFGDAREMGLEDNSVHLIVTSPPYWEIKDYGVKDQIGFGQSYDDYIDSLNQVWDQCVRVLHPGCKMVINIGDQYLKAKEHGRYRVAPIRSRIIQHLENHHAGLDYMGAIIWQKVSTCKPSGGAAIMGSFPNPRNGVLKLDYEFLLIFKKLGKQPKVTAEQKAEAAMTNEEWNRYFVGHWKFPGERMKGHQAMFPIELPRRIIKMYSFPGETVLDPFLGSGSTIAASAELNRSCIGYELNSDYMDLIQDRAKAKIDFSPLTPRQQCLI